MDDMLIEQLEWLLSSNMQGNRFARHLLLMTGCFASENLPENINQQMVVLSRQVMLQDVFDTLVASLNQFSKSTSYVKIENTPPDAMANVDLTALFAQIEDARQQLSNCAPVNYAEIVAWVVAQAKKCKLWNKVRRR